MSQNIKCFINGSAFALVKHFRAANSYALRMRVTQLTKISHSHATHAFSHANFSFSLPPMEFFVVFFQVQMGREAESNKAAHLGIVCECADHHLFETKSVQHQIHRNGCSVDANSSKIVQAPNIYRRL